MFRFCQNCRTEKLFFIGSLKLGKMKWSSLKIISKYLLNNLFRGLADNDNQNLSIGFYHWQK